MKKYLFFLFLFGILTVSAQNPAKYWVQFKDKEGTPYTIDKPEEYLSPRALELRQKYHIPITMTDLPVNPEYVKQVLAADSTSYLCTQSKWLNGITIYSTQDSLEKLLTALPFVAEVEMTSRLDTIEDEPIVEFYYEDNAPIAHSLKSDVQSLDYGSALLQTQMNNAQWLHRMGYYGEGMQMMIMDGGFHNVDSVSYFQTLRDDHRLLGARNFVQPDVDPFRKHSHGTMVLSCIASYMPGELVGTAPMAQFYLCQTEDARSETKVEEDYWVAGVEWADYLGCQVLNSSLGYTKFDDTVAQHRSYEDLNGLVSRASRAATIAASKGMIVCNSAGNEGASKWKYLGTPADADAILTVGAVRADSVAASFSSWGPTSDGRVKPDACAVGMMAAVCNPNGKRTRAAGTSFSSPILSGMVACLWQAFPEKDNYEIMEAVRQSGNLYWEDEHGQLGFGITDFLKAYNILRQPDPEDVVVVFDSFTPKKDKKGSYELIVMVVQGEKVPVQFSLKSGRKLNVKGKNSTMTVPTSEGDVVVQGALYQIKLKPLAKNEPWRMEELELLYKGETLRYVIGLE